MSEHVVSFGAPMPRGRFDLDLEEEVERDRGCTSVTAMLSAFLGNLARQQCSSKKYMF